MTQTKMHDLKEYLQLFFEWSEDLENVMEPGEELPFDNDPEAPTMNDNPMNPYDANSSLRKVKASVPGVSGRSAGTKKGAGSTSRGRFPGGFRSSAGMKQGY